MSFAVLVLVPDHMFDCVTCMCDIHMEVVADACRGSVTCPVAHLAAGCPVMRDAPRSCHVDISARACVGKPAHQGRFASSAVTQRSQCACSLF